MDIVNNLNKPHSPIETGGYTKKAADDGEPLSFKDNGWSDSAADAVKNAFDNMDDFLLTFKESQGIENSE